MSEHGCYSPSFKKPSDVLRMRRKRARSDGVSSADRPAASASPLPAGIRPFSPGPLVNSQAQTKRRNPFANIENTYNSPRKRACTEDGGPDCSQGSRCEHGSSGERPADGLGSFSERLLGAESIKKTQKPVSVPEDESLFEEDSLESEKSPPILESPAAPEVGDQPRPEVCPEYPADWSLKTRVLITSPRSFSWAEHLKAQEEAQGLNLHCRAEYDAPPQHIQEPRSCAELRCGFQQCLQYWQHPSLPWLSLFPRIGAERSFSGKSSPWNQDVAVQQSLMSEWSVSLTSLYSLLKARLCPYFYLCSYQFTVSFRAAGLSGTGGISALVSPTTRGLREAMKAEGFESQLCYRPHWVLFQYHRAFVCPLPRRKEHSEVRLDHRPESVVLVEGSNTFTLINFLINCKSLVAAAGSQAGLPPTLLAPSAFRGATLHTLKARSVNVKTQVRTGYQDVCSLEVTGPIMPHALHALTPAPETGAEGDFSVVLYTHEPSAVLNVPVADPHRENPAGQELGGCGLQPSTVQQLTEPSTLGKGALRNLHMKDYSYSWRS
ncbi:LOW QUALITY PROTEIN: protein downstream neighbor of son homolog [Trichomycterus rosablanca]|uniref:LOW QUALITY PROTEIN: protein downstream neighbor of son homolog n=1 Tax=Trichomycterus rosablanca TaxID=2290929 RepID=UPI002F35D65E